MQTIQFKVENTSLNFLEELFKNLKIGIKDFSITKDFSKTNEEIRYDNNYFKSKENEYIFYLLELDGEIQQKKLNIERIFYKDKEKAKKWRNKIMKMINPDISKHPMSTQSTKILNEIYKDMMKNAK
jgi:hypothetical protein